MNACFILSRPDPATATVDNVIGAIDEITEWDWRTSYSHGHIVIDDFNLEDNFIFACLCDKHRRKEWVAQKIKEGVYPVHVRQMDMEVTRFLRWLLRTPSAVREDVMDKLFGDEETDD